MKTSTANRSLDLDDVNYGFRKGVWGFLRQIVTDATIDDAVRISAREFLGVGTGVQMWCTIGITFKSNGGYGDVRAFGKPFF